MKKSISSNKSNVDGVEIEKDINNKVQEIIDKAKIEASNLSYQGSLKELDLILKELQDENIEVEKININYLKGRVFLERCEELLKTVEQTVVDIDMNQLNKEV